jgi:hypothetical protein
VEKSRALSMPAARHAAPARGSAESDRDLALPVLKKNEVLSGEYQGSIITAWSGMTSCSREGGYRVCD